MSEQDSNSKIIDDECKRLTESRIKNLHDFFKNYDKKNLRKNNYIRNNM